MSQSTDERFHALDATRAFALMLGVVFHIAWAFMPENRGVPFTDESSSGGFSYFFCTSHTFRMQLFFLIAGFFARMLYHRRGAIGFAKNRISRIAFPFAIAWLILIPLLLLTWVWGQNLSGQNLTPVPLAAFVGVLVSGITFIPRSWGGLFSLGHLWFLYYLLIFYSLTVVVRPLALRAISRTATLDSSLDRFVAWCVRSPWSIIVLAMITGLTLWPMQGWYGIDTPSMSPLPSLAVVAAYGIFFVVGWLLHRQSSMLKELIPKWRWQLGLGMALSLPLFFAVQHVHRSGMASGGLVGGYPELTVSQVKDWPSLISRLNTHSASQGSKLGNLLLRLKPSDRERIAALSDEPSVDVRIGICKSLNSLLSDPDVFEPLGERPGENVASVATSTVGFAEQQETRRRNRLILEHVFAGLILPDPAKTPYRSPIKLGFSLLYAGVCWCFVLGTLGFFQEKCSKQSKVWRYIADSSYWVYLAHLPLVIWLQIWLAPYAWPGLVKFGILNAVSFLLLFSSYHFCVRSTIVGRILNGRAYPFTWPKWPLNSRGSIVEPVTSA